MKNSLAFIGLFVVGALLMFAFDHTITLFIGLFMQLAAIALGVWVIADPAFLGGDADEDA
jgi:hypothetical protein